MGPVAELAQHGSNAADSFWVCRLICHRKKKKFLLKKKRKSRWKKSVIFILDVYFIFPIIQLPIFFKWFYFLHDGFFLVNIQNVGWLGLESNAHTHFECTWRIDRSDIIAPHIGKVSCFYFKEWMSSDCLKVLQKNLLN